MPWRRSVPRSAAGTKQVTASNSLLATARIWVESLNGLRSARNMGERDEAGVAAHGLARPPGPSRLHSVAALLSQPHIASRRFASSRSAPTLPQAGGRAKIYPQRGRASRAGRFGCSMMAPDTSELERLGRTFWGEPNQRLSTRYDLRFGSPGRMATHDLMIRLFPRRRMTTGTPKAIWSTKLFEDSPRASGSAGLMVVAVGSGISMVWHGSYTVCPSY